MVYNATIDVPGNIVIARESMCVKIIELHKRVFEIERKKVAVFEGTFKHIYSQAFTLSTTKQIKSLMTCTDNKRWICDNTVY